MLARNYRFTAKNETGQTLAANSVIVKARRWKFASTGEISYEATEAEVMNNDSTITNGGYSSSSIVDNLSDLFIGGDFYFEVTAPASSTGDVLLYYERSIDGGTTWATNGLGTLICVLNFTAAETKGRSFSIT